MARVPEVLRTRIAPALVTALGVAIVTAGLLSYADPATAGLALASPTPGASAAASLEPGATADPAATADPGATPPTGRAVASRVVIPALRIDLPVIEGPPGYPPCDVAMYLRDLGQPGEGRASYVYAHARTGMFLPILEASRVNDGARMIGMLVQVFTSDARRYLYEITEVRRGQTSLADAAAATTEQLWLQTSEGPKGTVGRTQVIAERLLGVDAADAAEANPPAAPVNCE